VSTTISANVWRNSKSTGTKLLILVSLADQANDEGWCWPSVALIATRCRVSKRTVQRVLSELEDGHEIRREEKRGCSTRYQVTVSPVTVIDTGDDLAPVSPEVSGGDTAVTGGVPTVSPRNIIESSEPSLEPKKAKESRSHRLPSGWAPNLKARNFANERGLDVDHEAEQFTNHHGSKGSKFIDWDMAFRTWLGNSSRWSKPTRKPPSDSGLPDWWTA
jgi:hypothetical protein